MQKTIKMLKQFRKDNKITTQQFRTFKGQVIAGDKDGCLRGLKRMQII